MNNQRLSTSYSPIYTEGRAVKAGGAAGQGGDSVMMAVKPVVCGVGVKAQEVHD